MKTMFKLVKVNYFLILILLLFYSCKNENNKTLEITFLNESVNCIENLNYNNLHQGNIIYDKLYDSLSSTVINYKIYNNSKNKYFVVFNSNFFDNYDELNNNYNDYNKNASINRINFSMYSNYIVRGSISDESSWNEFLNTKNYYNYILYKDTLDFIKTKKCFKVKDMFKTRNINYISENSFIIYPNETKYFSTIINLPLRDYRFGLLPWRTIIEKNKIYQAGLTLYNKASETKKYLSPDLKKDIEENGYTIFDGIIESNKVPVKKIKM